MIASVIMGLLLTGLVSFYMQSLKAMYLSDQRMKLAGQINRFANELVVQGSRSNQFILYKTANPSDFNGPNPNFWDVTLQPNPGINATTTTGDRQIMTPVLNSAPLCPGGDFVVFVFYEFPKPINDSGGNPVPYHRVKKLEGYYLSTPNSSGIGSLVKVVIDLSAAPVELTTISPLANPQVSIESILTANWNTTAKFTTYFPLIRGLAVPQAVDSVAVGGGATTARLFYMTAPRNVIINGQIYSSRTDINTKDWKTSTNAFCFNITPRT